MASKTEAEAKARAKATIINPNTPQKVEETTIKKRGRLPLMPSEEAGTETGTVDYEKCREERIKENRERLENLGIVGLSQNVKRAFGDFENNPNPKRKAFLADLERNGAKKKVFLEPLVPTRRSSRLQDVAPVSYTESRRKKGRDLSEDDEVHVVMIEEGMRGEIYTEEHEKLLGSCETPWTLFVDGYGKDGKRIYDQIRGKSCHQCRQKTMGHRTNCYKCQLVRAQFCGDCLFMRYGENVLEANKTPNWTCPVCRGICNCSVCRTKKGWIPTGMMYRKIVSLGYKSVAHYLIQTKRSPANPEIEVNTVGHTEISTGNLVKSENNVFELSSNGSSGENGEDALASV